jgi:KUP system potassium uptake protein
MAMAITSVLFFLVVRQARGWSARAAWAVLLLFLAFDLPFVAANALKLFEGGWLPLSLALVFAATMLLWSRGRRMLAEYFVDHDVPIERVAADLESGALRRVPGVGVYFAARSSGAPLPLIRVAQRFGVVHQETVLLTVATDSIPFVSPTDRIELRSVSKGITRVVLRYGFMEALNVVADLDLALAQAGVVSQPSRRVYLLGRETITPSDRGRMGRVEEHLFAFMSRNAKSPTDWFGLPAEQVVEVGAQVDL